MSHLSSKRSNIELELDLLRVISETTEYNFWRTSGLDWSHIYKSKGKHLLSGRTYHIFDKWILHLLVLLIDTLFQLIYCFAECWLIFSPDRLEMSTGKTLIHNSYGTSEVFHFCDNVQFFFRYSYNSLKMKKKPSVERCSKNWENISIVIRWILTVTHKIAPRIPTGKPAIVQV